MVDYLYFKIYIMVPMIGNIVQHLPYPHLLPSTFQVIKYILIGSIIVTIVTFSFDLPASELLSMHRSDILPIRKSDNTRITIRRKFVLQDTLHQFRIGLDITKHLKVVFVGEPAVDDGDHYVNIYIFH